MAKILVVEDEKDFRDILKEFFIDNKYEVVEAGDIPSAIAILEKEKIDLILSDIRLPGNEETDGIELLKWVRKNTQSKFILMTGFAEAFRTKLAFDVGADDFLAKPFNLEEALESIQLILDPNNQNHPDYVDDSFSKVSIQQFVSKPKLEFDIFIRLAKDKYVRVGRSGSYIPVDRVHFYISKGMTHLYLKKTEFSKAMDFNVQLSKTIALNSNVSQEKKINFMKYTTEVVLEKAFDSNSFDGPTYSAAKKVLVSMIDIVTRNTDQLNLLDALNSHSDWIYAHSVGTALFAIMITKEMSMTSTQSFYNLGMAGLFHEISFKDLPKNITEKSQSQLTAEENALFETHPTMSRDILACLESSNGDILQLVYEHHEDQSGQGFPRRLGKNKLHPLSKIFLTADAFSTLVVKNPIHKLQNAQQAIETLKNVYKDRLDPVTIAALANLVKHNKIGNAPPPTGENA